MRFLLNADDDWIEKFRRTWYPRLHEPLVSFGDTVRIPLYAVGHVGENQYVGVLDESEETIEEELDDRGRRNPIACLKELSDGRTSEGSWVILHEDAPELVESGMQLHLTLFDLESDKPGRAIYAHYEDDWRERPISHLRGKRVSTIAGVEKATEFLNQSTFLTLK